MTKSHFVEVQTRRGYEVEDLGRLVILRHTMEGVGNYRAFWFFNEDGSLDESNPPTWWIERP